MMSVLAEQHLQDLEEALLGGLEQHLQSIHSSLRLLQLRLEN